MENLNKNLSLPVSPSKTSQIGQTSYRGFISIDQEMGKEIAMSYFSSVKKTVIYHKSFVVVKY